MVAIGPGLGGEGVDDGEAVGSDGGAVAGPRARDPLDARVESMSTALDQVPPS